MRSVGSAGRLARMSTVHRRVLTLEFDSVGTPLVGIVRDERGTGWPFSGWLGLASTLELAMGLRSSQVDADVRDPTSSAGSQADGSRSSNDDFR
jgi:hypothetical protein